MRQNRFPSNSADGQLADADKEFQAVKRAAQHCERHQERSDKLLLTALSELYAFGELLRTQVTEPGRSLVEEFVTSKGLPWNAVTQRNPYNALVKLAFEKSPSSQSQYATVLSYASDCGIERTKFSAWVQEGNGIKGRYAQATKESERSQRNSRERANRLKAAEELLSARERSSPVALPAGVSAGEGFVLVLAKADGAGKAAIIDVIETDGAALEPVLLRYAPPSNVTAKALLAAKPLGQLYRAIDLVLGCTADMAGGYERDVLLLNTLDRGRRICRVEAVSEAYTYAWAGMALSGHLEGLPPEIPFILRCKDAAFLRREFPNHAEWTASSDPTPRIHNSRPESSVRLHPLDVQGPYRVGSVPARRHKPVVSTYDDQQAVLQFLNDRKAEHERRRAEMKEKQPFSPTLTIQSHSGSLQIGLPNMLALSAPLGTSTPDRNLSGRELATGELTEVLMTLAPYGTSLEGSFVDTDVTDAALHLQARFDDDVLNVVVPTRSGKAINQSCVDLDLDRSN